METVDLNTASRKQLSLLYGVGDVIAMRIIYSRPFDEPYDLVQRGIMGECRFRRLAPYLTVSTGGTSCDSHEVSLPTGSLSSRTAAVTTICTS